MSNKTLERKMCHILRIKIKSIVKEMQTKLGGGGYIYWSCIMTDKIYTKYSSQREITHL